jgi:4-hydroxybenzoate polyprenyltransferase
LIVALTQYLLQYIVISPSFKLADIEKSLDDFHFFLLVLTTVAITISGYIINDILDYKLDIINKPQKVIVNKSISVKNAFRIYHLNNLAGFGLSLYLAIHIQNIPLVLIYPAAIILLFLYSKYLKKKAFWGNLIVAVFCAFVAGIVLFAERKGFFELPSLEFQTVKIIFTAYFVFALLSTLYREIIKDIEDFKGDQTEGCETLPINYGVPRAKSIALIFGIILIVFIIWWMVLQMTFFHSTKLLIAVVVLNFLPVLLSLFFLKKAQSKKDFSRLSQLAKYIMVSGLFYLLFLI